MLPDSAAVEPLLAEQDALRGWLSRLDEAGTAVPDSVRVRVRADYEQRLDGVTERLRAHADTIAARLADDQADHAGHVAQLETAEQGLAEAQLRHAVGEYDSARFSSEQASFGDEILRCRLGRDAAQERIDRMASILAMIARPSLAGAVAEVMSDGAAEPDAAPVVAEAEAEAEPEAEVGIEDIALLSVFDEPSAPSDEVAPLSFRPGSGMVADQTRVAPRRPIPTPSAPPPIGMPADSLPSFVPPEAPVVSAPPVEPEPVVEEPDPLFGAESIVASGPATEPVVARTLRCGECGAMNKPGEWYCEQCGAELSAG